MEFNKKIIFLIFSIIFLFSNAQNYTDYVNPFIGTSNFEPFGEMAVILKLIY